MQVLYGNVVKASAGIVVLFVLAASCGVPRRIALAPDKYGGRSIEVLCAPAGPECMLSVLALDEGASSTLYSSRDDFSIGIVEVAWDYKEQSVDVFVCNKAGDPVILTYSFVDRKRTIKPMIGDAIENNLAQRYGMPLGAKKDRWGVPLWACQDASEAASYFWYGIGSSRRLEPLHLTR